MTDCNDSEGAVTVYCASGPCLIGAYRILLIKTLMAPEISILPVTSNMSKKHIHVMLKVQVN